MSTDMLAALKAEVADYLNATCGAGYPAEAEDIVDIFMPYLATPERVVPVGVVQRYLEAEQAFANDGQPSNWIEYEETQAALLAAIQQSQIAMGDSK